MAGTENTKASELLHTPGGVRDIMAVLVPESWRYSIR